MPRPYVFWSALAISGARNFTVSAKFAQTLPESPKLETKKWPDTLRRECSSAFDELAKIDDLRCAALLQMRTTRYSKPLGKDSGTSLAKENSTMGTDIMGKRVQAAGASSVLQRNTAQAGVRPVLSGKSALLTEKGYQQLAKLRKTAEMSKFVRRIVDQLALCITDDGGLSGFSAWYSGEKATQSFAHLRKEIIAASKSKRSWVSHKCDAVQHDASESAMAKEKKSSKSSGRSNQADSRRDEKKSRSRTDIEKQKLSPKRGPFELLKTGKPSDKRKVKKSVSL